MLFRSERERGVKFFTRTRLNQTPLSEDLQLQIQLISLIHEHVACTQPSIIEYIYELRSEVWMQASSSKDQQIDLGMVAAI